MIYCQELNFCFVAVPKTGTTSIERFLVNYFDENDITYVRGQLPNTTPDNINGKHVHLKGIQKMLPNSDIRKIGFTRNPWGKVVSWFNYLKINTQSIYSINKNLSFEEFVHQAPNFVFTNSFEFLTLDNQTIGVDFLGRYESIEQDFKSLCSFINIAWSSLPKLNCSNGNVDYREVYNSKTKDLVAERFRTDIKLFGYEF